MRRVNGGSRTVNTTLNAAANAIISADSRVQHSTKRKGSSFWSMYWCFGSHKNNKRIGHAFSSSESDRSDQAVASTEESHHLEARLLVVPFAAPPSSPASFYPSESPSVVQSPVNMFLVSSGMYSPSGPTNIFAIGPYANEPQLVSPPVFSNFTTEPSTAPVTPPSEYVHLTTPSSPEVPFARLLEPTNSNSEVSQAYPLSQYEFQSYQYYPGSPVGQLISPRSGFSSNGTSSPYLDFDHVTGSHSLRFPATGRPKYLTVDKKHTQWGSRYGSGSMTPDSTGLAKPNQDWGSRLGSGALTPASAGQRTPTQEYGSRIGSGSRTPDSASRKSRDSCIKDLQNYIRSHSQNISKSTQKLESLDAHIPDSESSYLSNESRNTDHIAHHRVSFDLSAVDVLNYVEKKQATWTPSPIPETSTTMENSNLSDTTTAADESITQKLSSSSTLVSGNEFNFDNTVNNSSKRSDKLNIRSDWWANEKITFEEGESSKGWPFYSATLQNN